MYIIDGYNLLFAKRGPSVGAGIVPEFNALVGRVGRFCRERGTTARIYLDPLKGANYPGTQRFAEVEVVRLPTGVSADRAIQDLVAETRDTKAYTVVSSDREVAGAAEKRGFAAVKSEKFLAELTEPGDDPEGPEKSQGISSVDAESWMKIFGIGGQDDETGGAV